jgi:hypothetical protein
MGLRGFLVELRGDTKESFTFPGIVFTNKSDEVCSWVYIGDYQPAAWTGQAGDRVLPFYFRLPDVARCSLRIPEPNPDLAARLLEDPKLRYGWQLAEGTRKGPALPSYRDAASLLEAFVQKCVLYAADAFPEHALWKALTEVTFDACSHGERQTVRSFLDLAEEFISSRALPVRLPRISESPILKGWITDVLRPLADNWDDIRCRRCQSRAADHVAIRLQVTGMTSEGSIEGRMACSRCGPLADKVTLLTHCHACRHYPLIIGKNPLCACGGLICGWRDRGREEPCTACKKSCGQHRLVAKGPFKEGADTAETQHEWA